jgi:sugar lactone lactonase YvrE
MIMWMLAGHSLAALLLGAACSAWLLHMPDGSGPVLQLSDERLARLASGEGKLAAILARDPEQRLRRCVHHHRGAVVGPESLAALSNGSLLALDRYGFVHRADPRAPTGSAGSGEVAYALTSQVAYVGPGRPLGAEVEGERFLFADSLKGLMELRLDTGELRVLANRLAYANDLALDRRDGRIYLTSSTREPVEYERTPAGDFYDTMGAYMRVMLRGDTTGRLLSYGGLSTADRSGGAGPSGGLVELLSGIFYANGVALSASGDFVLVVETLGLRVLRLWLEGPRAGQVETFVKALPGFPDGISLSEDGRSFWLSIVAPWSPAIKIMPYRVLRGALARMLRLARRFVKRVGLVLQLRAEDGEIVGVLADADGSDVAGVSAVTERAGHLLLGQLLGDSLVVCPLD